MLAGCLDGLNCLTLRSCGHRTQHTLLTCYDPPGLCREYNPAHIATPPYRIFVRTESPFLKDKLDVSLTLTIEEVEPGVSCRQVR